MRVLWRSEVERSGLRKILLERDRNSSEGFRAAPMSFLDVIIDGVPVSARAVLFAIGGSMCSNTFMGVCGNMMGTLSEAMSKMWI